ncbi:MAG: biopolymer transporter ExbD [Myxococcota bacterium]
MRRLWNIPKTTEEAHIDIGPLIDIVFILLIFFMISTTFVQHLEIPLELPGASTGEKAKTPPIRITLTGQGDIFVEGQPVHAWMVQDRVRQKLQINPTSHVLITADTHSETGRLIDVVDQCRKAGAQNVSVDTERKG